MSDSNSFFLFGARGTGKTTLINSLFPDDHAVAGEQLSIHFLKEEDEELFGRRPDHLSAVLRAKKFRRVIIDEVQKFPKILDIVHLEIEKNPEIQFILTGSSARKLRIKGANLLAGRAFVYHLWPLSFFERSGTEQARTFDIRESLEFGDLPKVALYLKNEDRNEFLRAYIRTYLREEIAMELIVRDLEPFRDFLEFAAQNNGKILNYSKIAKAVSVSDRTIHSYYQILEDTLMGFHVPSFHRSIRKRQRSAPKFYFFDCGVKRAIDKTLTIPLQPKTYAFGDAFEHYITKEVFALNEVFRSDFKISYLRSKDDAEIDLVIERPGKSDLLVEIKSSDLVGEEACRHLHRFSTSWDKSVEAQVWSLDPLEKKYGDIVALPWAEGLRRLFNIPQ